MNIIPRSTMIRNAVVAAGARGAHIYANGKGGQYGSTLPSNDTTGRVQSKVEIGGEYNRDQALAIINEDPRVERAYITRNGTMRVNFHKSFAESPIG